MNLKNITQPIVEPILLTEAKLHLRVTSDVDNTLIANLIKTARQHAENFTGRVLASATFELIMDIFPSDKIKLPMPPVKSVTSIKYTDSDGLEVEWDDENYIFYNSEPAIIVPAYGISWPSFTPFPVGAVKIRYIAGYEASLTDASLIIPEPIRQAILLLIGHLYEHREEVSEEVLKNIPMGIQSLLYPYKIWSF
jgi:uncharacterized phiE125 gp8 family phage protein